MQLRNSALAVLSQLLTVIKQLKPGEYNAPLSLLSENSIGKHVRHILEFFDLLINVNGQNVINYDNRNHDLLLESNKDLCIQKIDNLISSLEKLKEDENIYLEVSYSTFEIKPVMVNTSINRELAYNIEHAIHHMAIIKIALISLFPEVQIPKDFGVAYSTIRYQKNGS